MRNEGADVTAITAIDVSVGEIDGVQSRAEYELNDFALEVVATKVGRISSDVASVTSAAHYHQLVPLQAVWEYYYSGPGTRSVSRSHELLKSVQTYIRKLVESVQNASITVK